MTTPQLNLPAIRRTKPRSRPYYYRRCKRGNFTTIDSLPDELLFEILTRVSAQDLHENARIVCKRWKRLIHGDAFASEHLRRPTGYGLLLPIPGLRGRLSFVTAAQGGEIEVSELSYKLELSCTLRSCVRASCNGLVLEIDGRGRGHGRALRIVNPVTKGCFDLPKLPDFAPRPDFGMAYAAASMEYKVVATCYCRGSDYECCILTVGVDNAWRHVSTQQLSAEAKDLLRDDPIITEGFMHWSYSSTNKVLTMNVEAEVFAVSHAPLSPLDNQVGRIKYHYLSTGRYLSVLIPCGDSLWEVWEMKSETGEWRKPLPNIDLKAHNSKIRQFALEKDFVYLVPVGWVKYPEVLLFLFHNAMPRSCIIYHLDNDEIESVKLPAPFLLREALVHKNSLVSLS